MDWTKSRLLQNRIERWANQLGKVPPYGEWRLPIMIITMSGFIFIVIITGFGLQIDGRTGEPVILIDWSQYIDEDTGYYDPWIYDPYNAWISQNRTLFISWFSVLYFATICLFCHEWFRYMRWKCKHGYDRVDQEDNWDYMIKKRSKENVSRRKN